MVRAERPSSFEEFAKSGKSKDRKPSRGRGSSKSYGRSSSRGPSRGGRPSSGRRDRGDFRKKDFQKTKVTCSSCNEECEVPFKPDLSKPVYCDACFAKKGGSGKISKEDIDSIHEKLDKIMKSLKIK
ncbi:hypothetical protein H8D83_02055 [Candidatus Woesearchaeota archaeon]|nr:hypothetical protein [Candidatus Woesearchaeota archaeon]MBL7051042.1 hypothetical protein [Candidatus Woesearchaeota archaeon]